MATKHVSLYLGSDECDLAGDELLSSSDESHVTPSIVKCDKHRRLVIEYFCKAHSAVFCNTCKLTDHRICDTTKIDAYTTSNNPKHAFDGIWDHLTNLENSYARLHNKRTNDKTALKGQLQKCLDDMKRVRREFDEILDSLEEKMKAEIMDLETNISNEIDDHLIGADATLHQIREKLASLEECQKTGQKEAMFIGLKKTEGEMTGYENLLTILQNEMNDIHISFSTDDKLSSTMKDIKSFGRLNRPRKQQPLTSVLKLNVSDPRHYDVGCKKVQSVVFLSDGRAILACENDGLILLDRNFQEKSRLKIRAVRACKFFDSEIIVSLGKKKQLQFVEVLDSLVGKKTLNIGVACCGVDYNNGEIFVGCGDSPDNAEIRVLTRNGELKRVLGVVDGKRLFTDRIRVRVNPKGDRVFISEIKSHTVTCLDRQGGVLYQYSDKEDLKCPNGILVDGDNNILVSGGASHNIEAIAADGKTHRTVLTERNGISSPLCVAYRPSDGVLAVGTCNVDGKKNPALHIFNTKL
ncbi:uncharacterized protein LOC127875196 [Dreissena polymorpha]|uniref:B box-type domain-containing protein n=1 Tax=Dreissena polymorpha TaxID=45954 RepID=A0A9D4L8H8_DREPO|nr:uncharacterized protein LOC127875196 [Dreissena polymorpha]KAH3853224.1 hypothetical protein DPMN_095746 [Dreissena polymorpha]